MKMTEPNTAPEQPVILPEEAVPPEAADCRQCELWKQRKRMIWGEGSPGAPVFVILDNPGARETADGTPFVCGTRETLQAGIRAAGLEMSQVYITYLLKCRPIRAYDKPQARAACSPNLRMQLAGHRPRVLIGLGNIVAQSLMGDNAEVKSLRGSWHAVEGYPVLFSYHPLAVRRRPNLMKLFISDLTMLANRLQQEALHPPSR